MINAKQWNMKSKGTLVAFDEIQSDYTNQNCTASRILEKRRQLSEVHDALEAQKDEFARKIDAFRRREDALRKKDLRLQDSLIKFNKFLQENENKRTRALKRCADECKVCEEKDREIVQLQELLDAKAMEEKELDEKLSNNKKYHCYLTSVINQAKVTSDDYTEIQDILDRYQTLKSTNDDLLSQLRKNTKDHEASRLSYTQFTKKSSNAILNMNNEIAALQKEMDQLTVKSNNIESLDDGAARDVTDLTAELSQVFVVVNQILGRFESRRSRKQIIIKGTISTTTAAGNPPLSPVGNGENLEVKTKKAVARLDKIAEYMTDYKSIADEWEISQGKKCIQ